jgi:hypothetical protein
LGVLIIRRLVTRQAPPLHPISAEPSVMSVGDPVEVTPGSLPAATANLEVGLLGPLHPNAASVVELVVEDH